MKEAQSTDAVRDYTKSKLAMKVEIASAEESEPKEACATCRVFICEAYKEKVRVLTLIPVTLS